MKEFSENHWESIQAKTFTKWVNDKLVKGGYPSINNIYEDFKNGVSLGDLLEVLLKTRMPINKKPYSRIQKVENLEILLKNIKRAGVVLINIGPEDIVDGNKKLILGLVWTLISKLSISEIGGGDLSVRDELIRWCKEATKDYSNVNIVDLSKSWQDGLGFNALIHNFRPDLIENYEELTASDRYKNLEQAFMVADKKLGIPRLLDIEDVADVIRPDEKSMITYLSQYYQKFNHMQSERNSKALAFNILNKIDWSIQHKNLYEIKARAFLKKQALFDLNKKEFEGILKSALEKVKELNTMNSHLTSSFVELHTIYSSINGLHKMYNFKPYEPTEEIAIDKIEYDYFNINTLSDTLELCRLLAGGEQEEIGEEIREITTIVDHKKTKEVAEAYKKSLLRSYVSETVNEDSKEIRAILKNYLEFLNELSKEESHRENIITKSKALYAKMASDKGGDLSLNDLKIILNKVGLVVDDDILNMLDTEDGKISNDAFEDAIRVFTIKKYDYVNIRKALKVVAEGSDHLSLKEVENELKNLTPLAGESREIEINQLVKEFIKED